MPKSLTTENTPPARWPAALDRAALAEYLSVSLRTIDKFSSTGELRPDFKIGDSPRWSRENVDQWILTKAAS
jgi:predicted DNA-binding transcriptional regulator AlpA